MQLVQIDSEPLESRSVSPENIYNKLLFESVVDALAELTPSQRLAFLLRHYEGMSYDEIANAMNCSSGTVKKGVSRAIVKLRARLSPAPDTPEETLTSLAKRVNTDWSFAMHDCRETKEQITELLLDGADCRSDEVLVSRVARLR